MRLNLNKLWLTAALFAVPAVLPAQFSLPVAGRKLQVHSFASQGFAYSNQNNFLTMKTSEGSFAFTDGGVNVSTQLTDSFRVGAQGYARNIGRLGQGHVELDWAFGDYKIKDWLGVRAGKVKTAFGLYNDTQDMDFLHTWAILPQSVYPIDLRSNMIAHTGVDLYGEISLKKLGSVAYTAYVGSRPNDPRGGYYYSAGDNGSPVTSFSGRKTGVDFRWTTPLQGLSVGTSWMDLTMSVDLSNAALLKIQATSEPHHVIAFYSDFQKGPWHLAGEYRQSNQTLKAVVMGRTSTSDAGDKAMFVSAAYRLSKRLEIGAYNSRYYVNAPRALEAAADHIFDQAITARFDISNWWNFKVEGHFMRGYGDTYSAHGFYPGEHIGKPNPETNMLVLRSGWNF